MRTLDAAIERMLLDAKTEARKAQVSLCFPVTMVGAEPVRIRLRRFGNTVMMQQVFRGRVYGWQMRSFGWAMPPEPGLVWAYAMGVESGRETVEVQTEGTLGP